MHVGGLLGDAAEEVASSDNDADLAAKCVDGGDFGGDFVDEDGVDAEALARGQGFSRDLEEDSFVHVRTKYRMLDWKALFVEDLAFAGSFAEATSRFTWTTPLPRDFGGKLSGFSGLGGGCLCKIFITNTVSTKYLFSRN